MKENKDKIILHLCASEFGSDTLDYKNAGYDVRYVDKTVGVENYHPPKGVYGIIANPPCTMFSIARTRAATPRNLEEGMRLVKECLRIIWEAQFEDLGNSRTLSLKFWAIENPGSGLLRNFMGKPAFEYSPSQFGDNFSKRTALWGNFTPPIRPLFYNQIPKNMDVAHKFTPMSEPDRQKRTDLRSIASPYFTKAFFAANP